MTQSKGFEEFCRRTLEMRRLTKNELINTYWQHIEEIADNGFAAFILRGSLCWQSPESKRVESKTGSVWLKSDYYDPDGKPITDEPVKVYLQWYLNLYQIWGGIQTDVDPQDKKVSKEALEQTIRDIYLLCNAISLTTGVSLSWYPARFVSVKVKSVSLPSQEEPPVYSEWRCIPLQRKQDEQISTCVKDDYFVNEVFPLFEYIRNINNREIGALLRRAMAWHATGNFFGSGLNRFLNYWESIELLTHFFYKRLPHGLTGRPLKSEKKDEVLRILNQQITRRNCLAIARQCAGIVPPTPSAKSIMQSALPVITGRKILGEALFIRDSTTGKSLYDIRNDIVHGNHCDHDLEFTELVEARLHDMRSYSRDALWLTVQRVPSLEKHFEA